MIRTAQTRILIDISDSEDDNQEWDEKYWIGNGKKFPDSGEVPALLNAVRALVAARKKGRSGKADADGMGGE